MAQASRKTTRPSASAQFETSGYVLTEDEFVHLRDLFAAMDAVAFAYDQPGPANYDLTGDMVAALIRSWSRHGVALLTSTPFTSRASATYEES